jgi:glutamate-1-semialdehyde 2,1-aminomutase/spore coat polysaccharide biosynthesis protein SpsF
MADLGGRTVLEEVLRRCRAVPGVDVVVCAIPEGREDAVLRDPAERSGAVVVEGAALDVRSRYARAAAAVGASVVMRVTSDCPLIDPALCAAVLAAREATGVDYCSNNLTPGFPHGLDCEAFTTDSLVRSLTETSEPFDVEHVTPWLRRSETVTRAALNGPGGRFLDARWTLDYPEDIAFLRAVFALLPPPPAIPGWREVYDLLDCRSEIVELNRARKVER